LSKIVFFCGKRTNLHHLHFIRKNAGFIDFLDLYEFQKLFFVVFYMFLLWYIDCCVDCSMFFLQIIYTVILLCIFVCSQMKKWTYVIIKRMTLYNKPTEDQCLHKLLLDEKVVICRINYVHICLVGQYVSSNMNQC
jgi:hypothetical protein